MPNNGVLNNGVLSAIAGGIEPFCRPATIQGSGIPSYWIRIRVRNKGRSVAKCCVRKLMEW